MRITIFGTGYIGLVTGACFASVGHDVFCVDIDRNKIDLLRNNHIPIYEPGLEELVKENQRQKRLCFTTDAKLAIEHAQVIFIAVGTPPQSDGSVNLTHVYDVAEQIATHLQSDAIVVNKSTVPVGTAIQVEQFIADKLASLGKSDIEVTVCSNPEFLKEGAAIDDFRSPDRIVIGTENSNVKDTMSLLYAAFSRNHQKIMFMDSRSAELTKYAANAMLATKISFMNEMANIAEHLGADIESVREGIGADRRIGYHFIYAGCGYGGSCFPKDVKALSAMADSANCNNQLLSAVDAVNERQKRHLLSHLDRYFDGRLQGKRIAVWGLSFKPKTDDVREATSKVLISRLLELEAEVIAYDPHAMKEFDRQFGLEIGYVDNMMKALEQADALVICTEWRQFRSPDFERLKQLMNRAVIFDGRNMYDPKVMAQMQIDYFGIGRGLAVKR